MGKTEATKDTSGADHGDDHKRRLRTKNWALAGVLVAFVALVYFVSIVRMGMNTP